MLWRNGGGGGPRGNPFSANPSLDLSEFPSLTNRDSAANINPMSGRTPYGKRQLFLMLRVKEHRIPVGWRYRAMSIETTA